MTDQELKYEKAKAISEFLMQAAEEFLAMPKDTLDDLQIIKFRMDQLRFQMYMIIQTPTPKYPLGSPAISGIVGQQKIPTSMQGFDRS